MVTGDRQVFKELGFVKEFLSFADNILLGDRERMLLSFIPILFDPGTILGMLRNSYNINNSNYDFEKFRFFIDLVFNRMSEAELNKLLYSPNKLSNNIFDTLYKYVFSDSPSLLNLLESILDKKNLYATEQGIKLKINNNSMVYDNQINPSPSINSTSNINNFNIHHVFIDFITKIHSPDSQERMDYLNDNFFKYTNSIYNQFKKVKDCSAQNIPTLTLPASLILKVNEFQNNNVSDRLFNRTYQLIIEDCFQKNHEQLFRLLLNAHKSLGYPKITMSFGNNVITKMNIISLALLFKKEDWLNEVNPTKIYEAKSERHTLIFQSNSQESIRFLSDSINDTPFNGIYKTLIQKFMNAGDEIEKVLMGSNLNLEKLQFAYQVLSFSKNVSLPERIIKLLSLIPVLYGLENNRSFSKIEIIQNILNHPNKYVFLELYLDLLFYKMSNAKIKDYLNATYCAHEGQPISTFEYFTSRSENLMRIFEPKLINYNLGLFNEGSRVVVGYNIFSPDHILNKNNSNQSLSTRLNKNENSFPVILPENNQFIEAGNALIIEKDQSEVNLVELNKSSNNKKIMSDFFKILGAELSKTWFNGSMRDWFIDEFIKSKGCWQFEIEDLQTTKIFDPLVKFLINAKIPEMLSTQCVSEVINYFNFYIKSSENDNIIIEENLDEENCKKQISHLISKNKKKTLGKELSGRLSLESAESFFSTKCMEFLTFCNHFEYFLKKRNGKIEKSGNNSVPCFLITPDKENTRVELMNAAFNEIGLIQGLTADFYGTAQQFLKKETGLQSLISGESATLTLDQMNQLRNCLEKSNSAEPSAIILERRKRIQSKEIMENLSSDEEESMIVEDKPIDQTKNNFSKKSSKKETADVNLFRKFQKDLNKKSTKNSKLKKDNEPSEPEKPNLKKRKTSTYEGSGYKPFDAILPTKKANTALKETEHSDMQVESLFPIASSARLVPNEMVLDRPESLWKQISLSAINSVEFAVSSIKALKETLIQNKPLDYPVLKLLNNKKVNNEYELSNSFLMNYQKDEVQKQLHCQEMKLSRLLSFTMGLGKTRVFLEMIAHWIVEKNGVNLLIVPFSLLEPTLKECKRYFGTVRSEALTNIIKNNGGNPKIISETVVSALKNQNFEELALLLKQFSYFNPDKLYDELFDCKAYEKEHVKIWNGLKGNLQKHLKSLHDTYSGNSKMYEVIIQKISSALLSAKKLSNTPDWHKSLNLDENAIKEWLQTANDQSFYLGCGLAETVKFHQPILHAQCLLACSLLNIGIEPNQNIKRFQGSALTKLLKFSSDKIKICNKPEDLNNALNSSKNDSSIVITTEGTAQKAQFEFFNETNLASVVVDEAQKAHTATSKFYQWFLKLTTSLKQNKDNSPSILLVTGTPFENNFTEMWNLLKLANPNGFTESTHNALNKLNDETLKSLVDSANKPDVENLYESAKSRLIQSFAHFEVLRKEIILPLVCRAKMDDPNVLADWNNRIPIRKDRVIEGNLSKKAVDALDSVHKQYMTDSKSMDQFSYEHSIKRILLNPDLLKANFTEKDPSIQNIIRLFDGHDASLKTAFIDNSPYLNTLLNSSKFNNFIGKKQKGIIFTEHVAVASILQKAIDHKFEKNRPETKIYQGSLTKEQRHDLVTWFKEDSEQQRILIVMQEAGGVGLNLPEALKVFKMTINWNPAVDAQAIARALRVGSEGVRKIISLSFDIFLEHHCQAVQNEKLAWEDFFWNKTEDVTERFFLWCKLQSASCFHKYINNKKNKETAEEMQNAVNDTLEKIFNEIEAETLNSAVKNATPDSIQQVVKITQQPLPIKEVRIPALEVPNITPKTSQLNREKKVLNVLDWFILPLPLCGSSEVQKSYENAIKYGHFCKTTNDNSILPSMKNVLSKKLMWRDVIRNGQLESFQGDDKTNMEKSQLVAALNKIDNTCANFVFKEIAAMYNMEIYEFDGKENCYSCIKTIGNKKEESIRLYRKTAKDSQGKPYYHFDLLHSVV